MKFALVDIFPIILLLITFIGIKPIKPLTEINADYLSIETGKSIRGLLAILILFHHLALVGSETLLFSKFSNIGYLVVALFFFLSGYGLQKSNIKNVNYKQKFLLKRIPKILIPYIVVNILFFFLYLIDGRLLTLNDFWLSIKTGKPIVDYSWYIITILFFYLAFWILMILTKNSSKIMILGVLIWIVCYVVLVVSLNFNEWWYATVHLIVVGIFWATYEEKIMLILKKKYFFISGFVFIGFLLVFFCKKFLLNNIIYTKWLALLLTISATLLFTLSIILLLLKIKFGNKILSWLGKISLEIYLVQGLFIRGLRTKLIYIQNEFLRSILTIVGTIILAWILHIAMKWILKKYSLLIDKKSNATD